MLNNRTNDQKALDIAREKMARVVTILCEHLPPVAVLDCLTGSAIAVARAALGDEVAQKYFQRVADEIGGDKHSVQ